MGIAIKKMTEDNQDNENEHEHEHEEEEEEKSIKDNDWSIFCNNQLKVFETKWTKKLEDYNPDDDRLEQ